jgi:hypothetical protein
MHFPGAPIGVEGRLIAAVPTLLSKLRPEKMKSPPR